MQIKPSNWDNLLSQPHITQYRYTVNGEIRSSDYIQGIAKIEKPMMLEPVIGRCCTGSLTITVRRQASESIPKAAPVDVDCRLSTYDGLTVTDWIPQGRYFVSKRVGFGELVTLTCRDSMMFAGSTYKDKTSITSWPASMSAVLSDIASIMDVSIDSRTVVGSTGEYTVTEPDDDTLISEVLGQIAVIHGGNFIITESGKLRLVPFPVETSALFSLNQAYKTYTPYSFSGNTISRLVLKTRTGSQYTVGDDSGVWVTGSCERATQTTAQRLGGTAYQYENNTFTIPTGEYDSTGVAVIADAGLKLENETLCSVSAALLGRNFTPYRLEGAYMDPAMELGDTFSANYRGQTLSLIANTITANCTTGYTCSVENGVMPDDEEEVEYVTPQEAETSRTAARSYRNASGLASEITRATTAENGLSSEILKANNSISLVVKNGSIVAGSIILAINKTKDGSATSTTTITSDVINLTGYVTSTVLDTRLLNADALFAEDGYTGTINSQNVIAENLKVETIDLYNGSSEKYYRYSEKSIYIGNTLQTMYFLGRSTATPGEVSFRIPNAVTDLQLVAPEAGSSTYKLQKKTYDNDTWTDIGSFNRATSLSGAWSGGTFTVTADPQGEKYPTTLYDIASNGDVSKHSTLAKYLTVPVKVLYDDGEDGSETGYTQNLTVNASLIYADGWGAAYGKVTWPTAQESTASMIVKAPPETVDGTATEVTYKVRSTANDAYISILNPDGESWTNYAKVTHNQYNIGKSQVGLKTPEWLDSTDDDHPNTYLISTNGRVNSSTGKAEETKIYLTPTAAIELGQNSVTAALVHVTGVPSGQTSEALTGGWVYDLQKSVSGTVASHKYYTVPEGGNVTITSIDGTSQGDPSSDVNPGKITATASNGATGDQDLYITEGSWNSNNKKAVNIRVGNSSTGTLIARKWISSKAISESEIDIPTPGTSSSQYSNISKNYTISKEYKYVLIKVTVRGVTKRIQLTLS